MHLAHLTQDNYNEFQKHLTADELAKLPTLAQLIAYAQDKPLDGTDATTDTNPDDLRKRFPTLSPETDCAIKITVVVVDIILVGIAGFGLKQKYVGAGIRAAAGTMEASQKDFMQLMIIMIDPDRSIKDVVLTALRIIKLVVNLGFLGAVWTAIVSSLTWYDMVLYGVLGIAEVGAIIGTEGVAAFALLAQVLAKGGQLSLAVYDAVTTCQQAVNPVPPPPVKVGRDFLVTLTHVATGKVIAGDAPTSTPFGQFNGPVLISGTPETFRLITGKPGSIMDRDTITLNRLTSYKENKTQLKPFAPHCYYESPYIPYIVSILHADPNFAGGEVMDGDIVNLLSVPVNPYNISGGLDAVDNNLLGIIPSPAPVAPASLAKWRINMQPYVNNAINGERQVSYTHIVKILTDDGLGIGVQNVSGKSVPALVQAYEAINFILGNGRKYVDPIGNDWGDIEIHTQDKIDNQNCSLWFDNNGQLQFNPGGGTPFKLLLPWQPPQLTNPPPPRQTWAISYRDPVQIRASSDGSTFAPGAQENVGTGGVSSIKLVKKSASDALFFYRFIFVGLSDTS